MIKIEGRVASKVDGKWTSFRNNVAVNSAASALACGIAALDGKTNAIYHAIGVGLGQWDVSLPNPNKSSTTLVDEFYRKIPTSITYMVEHLGYHVVGSPNPDNELESPTLGDLGSSLLVGRLVEIISGTNQGDVREVTGVSGDVVTLDSDFSSTPDATTRFRVCVVSSTPQPIVEIETTFLADDESSDGQIREQGLFFGEATAELDTGTMLSEIRHTVLTKSGSDLVQVWRLKLEVV